MWPAKVLPWAAFNVMDAVAVSAVVGVSTAMAVPASPSADRLAAAAHIAARRFRFVFSIGYPFLGFGSGGCDGPCRPGRRPR